MELTDLAEKAKPGEPGFYWKLAAARKRVYGEGGPILPERRGSMDECLNGDGGVFQTETKGGVKFTCLFAPCQGRAPGRLWVVYAGAGLDRPGSKPRFPRWSYHGMLDADMLCIDDPMFAAHAGLRIGWFWGTKDQSWLKESLEIVDAVRAARGVASPADLTFFSSSGGGYAAIFAASLVPGSASLSINPTIWPDASPLASNFTAKTGMELPRDDALGRGSMAERILAEPQSRHLILANAASKRDWERQTGPLGAALGLQEMGCGLNPCPCGNALVWIYDAPGAPDPHASFETRGMFLFIKELFDDFRRPEFNASEWQFLALREGEALRSVYECRAALSGLMAAEGWTASRRTNGVVLAAGPADRVKYARFDVLAPRTEHLILFRCASQDTDEFTAGIYDFRLRRVVRFQRFRTDANCSFRFRTGANVSGLAFLIYAGPARATAGKTLFIESLGVLARRGAVPADRGNAENERPAEKA